MAYNIAEIGKKVKLLREAASFTQQQLADYLSVDQSLISKFEKGERSINSDALKQLSVLMRLNLWTAHLFRLWFPMTR